MTFHVDSMSHEKQTASCCHFSLGNQTSIQCYQYISSGIFFNLFVILYVFLINDRPCFFGTFYS